MTFDTASDRAASTGTALVLGGSGTTGSRVVRRLRDLGVPTRIGSRRGTPPFAWEDPATWPAVLEGVDRAYIVHPVLMTSQAVEEIRSFAVAAVEAGVHRLVLLSGHGSDDIVGPAEDAVRSSGASWTMVRPSWFNQNFDTSSDSMLGFRESILAGELLGTEGEARLGFVDADDIADVVVAALTQDGHEGKSYDITGPRALTFAEAVAEISRATGRHITYTHLEPEQMREHLIAEGVPAEDAEWMASSSALGDEELGDGVERALGRPPRDFAEYARDTAATGVWTPGRTT